MSSSVPTIGFTSTGLTLPTDSAILAGVQADMNAAFGGNLNPALSTPQGQLATSQAAILSAKNAEFARFVALVDPDTADGFMQDAIARIYFLTRRPAVATVVQVVCNGLVNVVIPVGALVRDVNNNIYTCTRGGVIGLDGFVILPFAAVRTGPIQCPPGAISGAPYRAIYGWDTATNTEAGVPGALVETRAEFEFRRKQSVAINGKGTLNSIYANVFNVAGVSDVYVTENTTSEAITVGETGYSLVPHSIYVGAVGGLANDVARAIWERKDAGADYNGNTSVSISDESGYNYPYPTYIVKYETPHVRPIYFDVQIAADPLLPYDVIPKIKAAIISAFSGGDGGVRARVGSTLFASRFYAPIVAISPLLSILSLQIGRAAADGPTAPIGIDEAPIVTADYINVVIV